MSDNNTNTHMYDSDTIPSTPEYQAWLAQQQFASASSASEEEQQSQGTGKKRARSVIELSDDENWSERSEEASVTTIASANSNEKPQPADSDDGQPTYSAKQLEAAFLYLNDLCKVARDQIIDLVRPLPDKATVDGKVYNVAVSRKWQQLRIFKLMNALTKFDVIFVFDKSERPVVKRRKLEDNQSQQQHQKQFLIAHRQVLAAVNSYFYNLVSPKSPFRQHYGDDNVALQDMPLIVDMSDDTVSRDVFLEMLRFIYTGQVVLTTDNMLPMIDATNKYCLDDIFDQCCSEISAEQEQLVTVENACILYQRLFTLVGSVDRFEYIFQVLEHKFACCWKEYFGIGDIETPGSNYPKSSYKGINTLSIDALIRLVQKMPVLMGTDRNAAELGILNALQLWYESNTTAQEQRKPVFDHIAYRNFNAVCLQLDISTRKQVNCQRVCSAAIYYFQKFSTQFSDLHLRERTALFTFDVDTEQDDPASFDKTSNTVDIHGYQMHLSWSNEGCYLHIAKDKLGRLPKITFGLVVFDMYNGRLYYHCVDDTVRDYQQDDTPVGFLNLTPESLWHQRGGFVKDGKYHVMLTVVNME